MKRDDFFYSIEPDNITLTASLGAKNPAPQVHRQDHSSRMNTVQRETLLNRGVRRHTTVLHGGDLPRFALGAVQKSGSSAPPQLNLGEVSIELTCNNTGYPLEKADEITARHLPYGFEWTMRWDSLPGCVVRLSAAIMGESGITAKLETEGNSKGTFLITLGGYRETTRTFEPSYFTKESVLFTPSITIDSGHIDMKCDAPNVLMHWKWAFYTERKIEIREKNGAIHCAAPADTVYMAAVVAPLNKPLPPLPENPSAIENEMTASRAYFEKLLAGSTVKTSSNVLDAGVHHALLNLEYCYMAEGDCSGWLEGGHYWNCYWTNNYQISAAIAAGQYERARKTLLFYGTAKDGCDPLALTGRATGASQESNFQGYGYDGLPYYLYQLWQYVEHTGDLSVVSQVFESVDRNLRYLIQERKNKSGLYSWHLHCNSFLYQADCLALHGDALSPSIMLAYGLDKFAKLLDRIGKKETADFYAQLASAANEKIESVLWNSEYNRYAALRDYAGNDYYAHYYTDLIFPMLYGENRAERKFLSLLHLKDSLLLDGPYGGLLMRVGKLKPVQFGNDNVMPVQMCEAARAFCAAGDRDSGYKLVWAAALANSIYTESPGSSPERLSDEGKGEYNYMFGNPAGSLLYGAISGVFGVTVTGMGTCLNFFPSMPIGQIWELKLPYVHISAGTEGYTVSLPDDSKVKNLVFSVCAAFKRIDISVNGKAADYSTEPALGGTRVTLKTGVPADKNLRIGLRIEEAVLENPAPLRLQKGEPFTHDQEALPGASPEASLRVLPNQPNSFDRAGIHNILLLDEKHNAYVAQKIIVEETIVSPVSTEGLTGKAISISGLYNSDTVTTVDNLGNVWDHEMNFGDETAAEYSINPKAQIVKIESGRSSDTSQTVEAGAFPNRVRLPVHQNISALELLYTSSCAVHLTNAQLGEIILRYENDITTIPIISGKNFDSIWQHFASGTKHIPAKGGMEGSGANSYVIRCDSAKLLAEVEIRINRPDAQLGLIAVKTFTG